MPSFNPSRTMGIAPRAYEDYFPTYSLGGSVQETPFARTPLAIPEYDPLAEQEADLATQQRAASLEAKQSLLGDTDFSSPEGLNKLQQFVTRGVISPSQAKAIVYTFPKTNRYSNIPADVAHASNQLAQINPNDVDAWSQMQKAINPENIDLNVQTHPQFQTDLRNLQKQIMQAQSHREVTGRHDPDEELIGKALNAGVSPDELQPYLDENGKVADKIGLRSATFQAGKNTAVLNGDAGKRLSELGYAASKRPTDDEKVQWMTANGINPASATPQQWAQAWNGVQQERMEDYARYYLFLQSQGYRKLPSGLQQPQAQPSQQLQTTPLNFGTEQEAMNAGLPKGSIITINGRRAVIS